MRRKQIAVTGALALIFAIALAGCAGGGTIEVKNSLEDYSWEELSQISAEIAKASDEEEAVEIAGKYNLVGLDGKLDGTQTKQVAMAGSQVPVQIIGFAHDDKTGDGKAGITFQFVNCIAEHEMNPATNDEAAVEAFIESGGNSCNSLSDVASKYPDGVPTSIGGWDASAMRDWLNSDVYSRLPGDLAAVIVAVDKQTSAGYPIDTSSVITSSDKLWLISLHELCGDIDWGSVAPKAVWSREGQQYGLFRNLKVTSYYNPNSFDNGNDSLVKSYNDSSCVWWLRSPDNYQGCFRTVLFDGDTGNGISGADYAWGVAPCFCI